MPSTIAHALFPATAVLSAGTALPKLGKKALLKLVVIAAFLGNSPDLDLIPASLMQAHWDDIHRNWGHNIFSVTALAFFGSWLIRRYVSQDIGKARAFFMSLSLVASHLVLDSLAGFLPDGQRPSIPLFFPLSDWSGYLPWKLFPVPVLKTGVHPLLSHALSIDFWTKVVFVEVSTSLLMGITWAAAFQLFFRISHKKRQRPQVTLPLTEQASETLKNAS